jgi:hypothetical protein
MVSAMAPIQPLRPKDFRLGELVSLAYLNRFLHHLLVTTAERFRLRVFILVRAFGTAVRLLSGSNRRLKAQRPREEWARSSAIRQDIETLSAETLESFRTLVMSAGAKKK